MFHILLSCDSQGSMECICLRMYVSMYIQMRTSCMVGERCCRRNNQLVPLLPPADGQCVCVYVRILWGGDSAG